MAVFILLAALLAAGLSGGPIVPAPGDGERERPSPGPGPAAPRRGSPPIVPRPSPAPSPAPAPAPAPREAPAPSGPIVPRAIVPSPSTPPAPPIRRAEVFDHISRQQRRRVRPGVYHWHFVSGVRYCHFLDPFGFHWFGFYHGAHFYWTRWHAGHWWWRDPHYGVWSYWDDGSWWRPLATGQAVPYTPDRPEQAWTSPDGSRMVQIAGPGSDAFLYDASVSPARFMKHLAPAVQRARFSGGHEGRPLRILLDLRDGGFLLSDRDGNPLEDAPAPIRPTAPAPPPAAEPPPEPPPPPSP